MSYGGGGIRTSRGEIDNFLEIGKTSKEEIQSTWPYPYQILDRNIWVYKGLKTIGYGGFLWLNGTLDTVTDEEDTLLLIKFDKNDCLKRYELQKHVCSNLLTRGEEVRQQAIKWDNSFETQSK